MKNKEELLQIACKCLVEERREMLKGKVEKLEQIYIDRYKFELENDVKFRLNKKTEKRPSDEILEEEQKITELKEEIKELENELKVLEDQIKKQIFKFN